MSKYKRLTYYLDDACTMLVMPQRKPRIELYVQRLAKLEDKIENGTLVELPLKVGDTVYSVDFIFRDGYEIDKKGNERPVHSSGWRMHEEKITDKNIYKMCDLYVNDKVYTTREAAEEKLKELKKN